MTSLYHIIKIWIPGDWSMFVGHHSITLSHSSAFLNYLCFNSPHLPISLPHTHLCPFGQLAQDEESTVRCHYLCPQLTFIVFFTLPSLCWTHQQPCMHDPWLAMVCWSGAEVHLEPGSWGGGGKLLSLRVTMAGKRGKSKKVAESSVMLCRMPEKARDGRERQIEVEEVCVVCFSPKQDSQNCCH